MTTKPAHLAAETVQSQQIERHRLTVRGVVQGVGFRPFVYGLATALALTGFVGNDSGGVFIEIEGACPALAEFRTRLVEQPPPLAHIDSVSRETIPLRHDTTFVIVPSQAQVAENTLVSPDVSICDNCLQETLDPDDRRYGYPFTNCTHCGPRFTIIQDIPYDRPQTTMAAFTMCPACQAEYDDPGNRRFHAQPNACPLCGPQVEFRWSGHADLQGFENLVGLPGKDPRGSDIRGSKNLAGFENLVGLPGKDPRGSDIRGSKNLAGFENLVGLPAKELRGSDLRGSKNLAGLALAQTLLVQGGIVAVKGLGGFHLACDATNDRAVQTLRRRKGRIDKPFAVMAPDVATIRHFAEINTQEERLLTGKERPIVLLKKKPNSPLSPAIAPGNPYIGVMLPYTPLHYLLLNNDGDQRRTTNDDQLATDNRRQTTDKSPNLPISQSPNLPISQPPILVMTSANFSNEPIIKDNEEALERLAPLADAFLLHNRDIHVHCDDSVIRVFAGQELPIRRSRGYAPFPVKLPFPVRPTLAVGGELKATFCLTKGNYAFMSQHIGDMENLETLQAFEQAVAHFQAIFRVQPEVLACDKHPGYLSSKWAEQRMNYERQISQSPNPPISQSPHLIKVQHHHAHIAAVMAENRLDGETPVIGFSFDGTGYGPDGAIWGGELLAADYRGFRRMAHLKYVPLPGGDAAVKRPYRVALAHLWAVGASWDEQLPPVAACTAVEQGIIKRQLERGLNTVPTSSMGRLFDAVAALIGVRQTVTYEAQAAIELEALATPDVEECYCFDILPTGENRVEIDPTPVVQHILVDLRDGLSKNLIAAKFHNAVAEIVLALSVQMRLREGLNQVALSGGVFQNVLLLEQTVNRLRSAEFEVFTHRLVPPNDGGLALGQAIIANYQ